MSDSIVNYKITQALERISKAFRVLLWEESKKYKISPIQIQILIFCLTHKQEMLKVSFLANEFDLTKATISDSVKVLLQKKYLKKIPDAYDSRSYSLQLTNEGRKIAKETSDFTGALDFAVNTLESDQKGVFLNNLLDIIYNLNTKDIISTQRMCLTCNHYSNKKNQHFCGLLNKSLKQENLQIDCDDHKLI